MFSLFLTLVKAKDGRHEKQTWEGRQYLQEDGRDEDARAEGPPDPGRLVRLDAASGDIRRKQADGHPSAWLGGLPRPPMS